MKAPVPRRAGLNGDTEFESRISTNFCLINVRYPEVCYSLIRKIQQLHKERWEDLMK